MLHWRHVQQHMHDEVLSLASANNPRSQIERESGTSTAALTTCHPARSHPRTRSRGASPRSTRLSECSDQSSLTSRSANASLDCTGPAAALRPSQSTESVGPAAALEPRESAEGDALAPLPSAALPVVGPTVKKAPRTSTELYAFALAAPRLDAPPLGEDLAAVRDTA